MTINAMFLTSGSGDGGPYNRDQMRLLFQSVLGADDGVLRSQLNNFAVTINGSILRTASGRAVVNGTLVESTANVDKTPTVPSVGTTGLRIVLRKHWANNAMTVELLEAADGTAPPPAVTQTDGTQWEISLATAEITTGGTIQALTRTIALIKILPTFVDAMQNLVSTGGFPLVWVGADNVSSSSAVAVGSLGQHTYYQDTGAVLGSSDYRGKQFTSSGTNDEDVGVYTPAPIFRPFNESLIHGSVLEPPNTDLNWLAGFAGSGTTYADAAQSHGIYFHFTGSGNIKAVAKGASVKTEVDTGIAPVDATERILEIEIDANAEARFFIDGALVATIDNTNFPPTSNAVRSCFGSRSKGNAAENFYGKLMWSQVL